MFAGFILLNKQSKIVGCWDVKVKGNVKGKPLGCIELDNVITIVNGAEASVINKKGKVNGNVEVETPLETCML